MRLFSKQKFFCNACGKECYSTSENMIGRDWKVCSLICMREVNWRVTLSILGEEYYPASDLYYEI